jgi:voltage-gated potassium channel Kch
MPVKKTNSPLKRLAPLYILILTLIVIILGLWGYLSLEGSADPFSVFYDTILMFKMESYAPDSINWQLIIARYLAMIIVGYGIYALAIDHCRKWWTQLKIILLYRNHTIIAGLGLKGYLLAKDLKANNEKVVVIEANPENIYIQRAIKEGVVVLIANGLDKRCWLIAGLRRAKRFILVMDSDDKNIETATLISQICSKRKDENPLYGMVHVENLHNLDLLKDHLDLQYGTTKIDINIFNTYLLAAQRIWDKYPPHGENIANPKGGEISILIAGYNETAEAFLVENMILSRYMDLENIRVLMVVNNSDRIKKELTRKYPFMADYLNYEVIEQPDDFYCNEKFISDKDFIKISRVFIFGDEDAEVILRAKKIKQCFYNRKYDKCGDKSVCMREPQFIVCLPEKTSVFELLNHKPVDGTNSQGRTKTGKDEEQPFENNFLNNFNILFFRQFTDTFSKSHLIDQNELNTVVAKIINYLYSIKYDFRDILNRLLNTGKIPFDPGSIDNCIGDLEKLLLTFSLTSNKPLAEIEKAVFARIQTTFALPENIPLTELGINYRWQLLTDRLEDSNIYSARHAQIKLLYPHETDEHFEALAPMEHLRWMAEKLAFQFRPGKLPEEKPLKKIVKEELKINSLIIPFEKIPESEMDKDYDPYRLLKLIRQITVAVQKNLSRS